MKGLLVHEVARAVGVHPETIRRLEKKGRIESRRDVNGWRRYSPEVVDKVKTLYALGERSEGADDE